MTLPLSPPCSSSNNARVAVPGLHPLHPNSTKTQADKASTCTPNNSRADSTGDHEDDDSLLYSNDPNKDDDSLFYNNENTIQAIDDDPFRALENRLSNRPLHPPLVRQTILNEDGSESTVRDENSRGTKRRRFEIIDSTTFEEPMRDSYDSEDDEDGLLRGGASIVVDNDDDDEDNTEAGEGLNRIWTVDHDYGDFPLTVKKFREKVESEQFTGERAIAMIHTCFTIDYGSEEEGSRAADDDITFHTTFHLDMLSIVGKPMEPIGQSGITFSDNINVTFQHYASIYSPNHVHGVDFDPSHRTFHIATGASREKWYVVMHPMSAPTTPKEKNAKLRTALRKDHAQAIADYIIQIFQVGELIGEGIQTVWRLGGPESQRVAAGKWVIFQETFMENWVSFVDQHSYDSFWRENEPSFHTFDCGANVAIEQNLAIQSLTEERRACAENRNLRGSSPSSGSPAPSFAFSSSFPSSSSSSSSSSSFSSTYCPNYEEINYGQLGNLKTELERKYRLENIKTISYALAANLNAVDKRGGASAPCCVLADRNELSLQYPQGGNRAFTFYPLAFHPSFGNFTSNQPPQFLADNFAVLRENMSFENSGSKPLSLGYFQAYSNIKSYIRHDEKSLLATKGIATGALTLPESEIKNNVRHCSKRLKLLKSLESDADLADPDAAKPYEREKNLIQNAIHQSEYAFRMEQVFHIDVDQLEENNTTFTNIVRPIFQMMRFFLQKPEEFTRLLRVFPPLIFPGVLCNYSTLFSKAIDAIYDRHKSKKGVIGIALSEGVAAMDRLGSYCFTGMPKSLNRPLFRKLMTLEALRKGAWPYINPSVLCLNKGMEKLNRLQWHFTEDGRPTLLHTAAIGYYYGPVVENRRYCIAWFRELGGMNTSNLLAATDFLVTLFKERWIPEMKTFITTQLTRSRSNYQAFLSEEAKYTIEEWQANQASSFIWKQYQPIAEMISTTIGKSDIVTREARADYATRLVKFCKANQGTEGSPFSSVFASWFLLLSEAIETTSEDDITEEGWIGAVTGAMAVARIECVPGTVNAKLSFKRVIRLNSILSTQTLPFARENSLKAEVNRAEERLRMGYNNLRIKFQDDIPFTAIPRLVENGFAKVKLEFQRKPLILAHYISTYNCLVKWLGDTRINLLFMIVLTIAASTVTPGFQKDGKEILVVVKRRDEAKFAVASITRMLWYLDPEYFPRDVDKDGVLCIKEMTKKIEHVGMNNRFLRFVGWVKPRKGLQRINPRYSDLELASDIDLRNMYKMLKNMMDRDAIGFIKTIFKSDNAQWVERCQSIIVSGQTSS